jgi:hypothetical protein
VQWEEIRRNPKGEIRNPNELRMTKPEKRVGASWSLHRGNHSFAGVSPPGSVAQVSNLLYRSASSLRHVENPNDLEWFKGLSIEIGDTAVGNLRCVSAQRLGGGTASLERLRGPNFKRLFARDAAVPTGTLRRPRTSRPATLIFGLRICQSCISVQHEASSEKRSLLLAESGRSRQISPRFL